MRHRLPFVLALGLVVLACGLSAAGEARGREGRPGPHGRLAPQLGGSATTHAPRSRRRGPVKTVADVGLSARAAASAARAAAASAAPSRRNREASGRERSAQFQAVADLLAAPRQMTITHDAREILFRYDDGRYVRLVPDAREHAGIAGGTRVTRKVRWEGDTLVAEVKLESNQKIVHEFELRLGGEQLVVTTTLEPRGSQDELQLRRVFDAAGE